MEMNYEPNEQQSNGIMNKYFEGFAEGNKIAGFLHGLIEGTGGITFTSAELKDIILTKITADMNIELAIIAGEVELSSVGECHCNNDSGVEL